MVAPPGLSRSTLKRSGGSMSLRNDPHDVPCTSSPDGSETYRSYPLPCAQSLGELREELPDWFARLIHLDPDQAKELFRAEWSHLTQPALVRLREVILRSRPYSLSRYEAVE